MTTKKSVPESDTSRNEIVLSPMRRAVADAVEELLLDEAYEGTVYIEEDFYAKCKRIGSLTRGQVDRALNDLALTRCVILQAAAGQLSATFISDHGGER